MDTEADLTKAIVRTVQEAMSSAGHTPQSLAKAAGMSRTTLDRRLGGLSAFNTAELASVARVLNTTLAALLNEVSAA